MNDKELNKVGTESSSDWGIKTLSDEEAAKERPYSVGEDPFVHRFVAVVLGIIPVATVIAGGVLAAMGKELPGSLIAIAGTAVGALGALFKK